MGLTPGAADESRADAYCLLPDDPPLESRISIRVGTASGTRTNLACFVVASGLQVSHRALTKPNIATVDVSAEEVVLTDIFVINFQVCLGK